MANLTLTGSITIGGTYNGLTITNGSITGGTFNATTINATTFAGGAFTGTTFNGVILDNLAWTTYTPTITAGSGTFTTVSAAGRYKQIGKTVFINIIVTITTNGSAAGFVQATLPVTSTGSNIIVGRENASTGVVLQGLTSAGIVEIFKYDNTYPGGTGFSLIMTGVYEAA